MARPGPLATAVVVLVGLAGFVAVNSAGGLVETTGGTAQPAVTQTSEQPPPATPQAPATTQAPAQTTTAAPTFPAEVVYAGRASASQLAIAVAVKGDQAAAYLCDGRSIEAWLRGTAEQGKVVLSTKDGSARLTAALDGQNLAGTASVGGREYPFVIGVAEPPAGLYRGSEGSTTIGWIGLPDGSQVGIARTGGSPVPAPALDPQDDAVTVDGQQIDVDKVAGDTTFG
jgi:hypothetical protein